MANKKVYFGLKLLLWWDHELDSESKTSYTCTFLNIINYTSNDSVRNIHC